MLNVNVYSMHTGYSDAQTSSTTVRSCVLSNVHSHACVSTCNGAPACAVGVMHCLLCCSAWAMCFTHMLLTRFYICATTQAKLEQQLADSLKANGGMKTALAALQVQTKELTSALGGMSASADDANKCRQSLINSVMANMCVSHPLIARSLSLSLSLCVCVCVSPSKSPHALSLRLRMKQSHTHTHTHTHKMGPKWVAMLLVGGNRQHVIPSCPV